MNETGFIIDHLTREALQRCAQINIFVPRPLMRFITQWLLVSRGRDLINADEEIFTKVYQSIYDQIIDNGPVIRSLKLTYFFKNTTTNFKEVQANYERTTKEKLVPLLENICNLTGTGKKDQEEIFKKIAIYIVAVNKMFSTKNSQMLAEAKCALRSILTTQDILDFATRKKHYRLDFLDRLGKIMCGILLFNKHAGFGGDGIRDAVSEIRVAYQNTMESVRRNVTKCAELIAHGLKAVSHVVTLDLSEGNLIYRLPKGVTLDDLKLFNKFNYLHLQREVYLHQLLDPLGRLKHYIEYNVEEFREVLAKLNDVIKFRLAIPSELVFPNFAKLFEVWYRILMDLYYLVEINRINDEIIAISTIEYPFYEVASRIASHEDIETVQKPYINFIDNDDGVIALRIKRKSGSLFTHPLQRFCALTLALSGGILVQSDNVYGVLPFQDQFMAFKRKDYGAFAEKNYKQVVKYLLRTFLQNPEMCILFNISFDSSPLSRAWQEAKKKVPTTQKKKTSSTGIQTEHCLEPCTLEARLTYSWNIWDYRRRAIQLANLKKCQTHSAQTNITYCSRDIAIQTYDTVSGTHRCNCSTSQESRLVCHRLGETGMETPSDCPPVKPQPEREK